LPCLNSGLTLVLTTYTNLIIFDDLKVTKEDQVGRCKNTQIGYRGICCRHCGGKAGKPGYGRYFPMSKRSFEQVFYKQLVDHITKKCIKCPITIKTTIAHLHSLKEGVNYKEKYGSREILYKRLWNRLRDESNMEDGSQPITMHQENEIHIDWCAMVAGSQIVTIQEHGYVSDDEFIAMAQMHPCLSTVVSIITSFLFIWN
jgi:hypothetical protein